MTEKGKMNAYYIYLHGELIDTVFDQETNPNKVKEALFGYDPNISVRRASAIEQEGEA